MTEAERALLIAVAQAVLLKLERSEATGYTALTTALEAVHPGAAGDRVRETLLLDRDGHETLKKHGPSPAHG